jgi:hypothetical protein
VERLLLSVLNRLDKDYVKSECLSFLSSPYFLDKFLGVYRGSNVLSAELYQIKSKFCEFLDVLYSERDAYHCLCLISDFEGSIGYSVSDEVLKFLDYLVSLKGIHWDTVCDVSDLICCLHELGFELSLSCVCNDAYSYSFTKVGSACTGHILCSVFNYSSGVKKGWLNFKSVIQSQFEEYQQSVYYGYSMLLSAFVDSAVEEII